MYIYNIHKHVPFKKIKESNTDRDIERLNIHLYIYMYIYIYIDIHIHATFIQKEKKEKRKKVLTIEFFCVFSLSPGGLRYKQG